MAGAISVIAFFAVIVALVWFREYVRKRAAQERERRDSSTH